MSDMELYFHYDAHGNHTWLRVNGDASVEIVLEGYDLDGGTVGREEFVRFCEEYLTFVQACEDRNAILLLTRGAASDEQEQATLDKLADMIPEYNSRPFGEYVVYHDDGVSGHRLVIIETGTGSTTVYGESDSGKWILS